MNRTFKLLCISLASGCIFFNSNIFSFAGANSTEPVNIGNTPVRTAQTGNPNEFLSMVTAQGGTNVHAVLKTIAQQANVNIILCACGENKVNVSFKDFFYEEAFKTVAEKAGLIMKKSGNVYIFSPEKPLTAAEIGTLRTGRIVSKNQATDSQSEYVSVKTNGNCDIRTLIEIIGKVAGIITVLEKPVEGAADVEFKDVYYETALKIIAENNGLVMSKSGNVFKFGKNK